MKVTVNNVGSVGQIRDLHRWQVPLEAWTLLSNVRIDNKKIKTVDGYTQFGNDTTVAPYYLLTAADDTSFRYIYPGLSAIYMTTDGVTHTDVTGTVPTGGADDRWNGGILNGLPVLNNYANVPQYMADLEVTTNFADLPGWTSTWRAKVVRPFRNFLFAFQVSTDSGSSFVPYYLKWSTSADTGGIPNTWVAATTNDAGDQYLAETKGAIIDALPLGDSLIIYKQDSAYACQYIGGQLIFRFSKIKTLPGLLAQDCVCEFEGGHFVLSDGEVYIHDGQNKREIMSNRNRDALFDSMDTTYYSKSFVFHHKNRQEIWICYPGTGATLPNKAYVWEYQSDVWTARDLPSNTTFMAYGVLDAVSYTWGTLAWNTWTEWEDNIWATTRFNAVKDYPVAVTTDSKIYSFESGNTANGTAIVCQARKNRFRLRDSDSIYRIKALYPSATGSAFNVQISGQMSPNEGPSFEGPYTFTPSTDHKIDCRVTGRYFTLMFSSESDVNWDLSGYEFDVEEAGSR